MTDGLVQVVKDTVLKMAESGTKEARAEAARVYREVANAMEKMNEPQLSERDACLVANLKSMFPNAGCVTHSLEVMMRGGGVLVGPAEATVFVVDPVSAPVPVAVAEPTVAEPPAAPAPEPPKKTLVDLVRDRQRFFVEKRDQLLADEKSRKPLYDDGLTDAWAEAVGTTPLYDNRGHWANVRAGDAFDVNGATVAARKSPWNDIRCAMLRNETCVLYCKHADDGWTVATWAAALSHLKANGVSCYYSDSEPRTTRYFILRWEAPTP